MIQAKVFVLEDKGNEEKMNVFLANKVEEIVLVKQSTTSVGPVNAGGTMLPAEFYTVVTIFYKPSHPYAPRRRDKVLRQTSSS